MSDCGHNAYVLGWIMSDCGHDKQLRLSERLAWHLSDALAVLKANGIKIVPTYGDDGTKALAEFRTLIPADLTLPRDYETSR